MPPLPTSIASPLVDAEFELKTQFATAIVESAAPARKTPTATAPPHDATFETIVHSVTLTVERSTATIAPPQLRAAFESIVQSVVLTMELSSAATAPPDEAEFEVIVQSKVVTVEAPPATTAPPRFAELKVIAQSIVVTVENSSAVTTPPESSAEFELIVQLVVDGGVAFRVNGPAHKIRKVRAHRATGRREGGVRPCVDCATSGRHV